MSTSIALRNFISAATADFGDERLYLRNELTSNTVEVRIQEDLKSTGGATLLTLDDYIQRASFVIHLVGPNQGTPAPAGAVEAIRKRYPDLVERLPWLAEVLERQPQSISYTQWEAYLALLHGRPLFCFAPEMLLEGYRQKKWAGEEAQLAHVERLRARNIHPTGFEDRNQLFGRVVVQTTQIYAAAGLAPPVIVADLSKLPTTYATRLYGRDLELKRLDEAWAGAEATVFAFDAIGGAGKTALVYHFVQALKAADWRGAWRVYAWSFYSQGSNEDRQTGADDFFKAAFTFFSGGRQSPPTDPRDKGVKLAALVQQTRSLLILDGLEPLQYATGRQGRTDPGSVGGIKDPGVRALLEILADNNPGLVVVTTRIALSELKGNASVVFEPLERIPLIDGLDLIRDLGVEPGTPPRTHKLPQPEAFKALIPAWTPPTAYAPLVGDDRTEMPLAVARQLIEAVEDLDGHALALTLVAKYLQEHHRGDVRALVDLPSLSDLHPSDPTRNPYRVMRAIEIALAKRIEERKSTQSPADVTAGRELAILFFLGFFDRPANAHLLKIVFPDAGALEPEAADIALADTDLTPIRKALYEINERLKAEEIKDWEKPQIEKRVKELREQRDRIIDAGRKVLVRRLFAAMLTMDVGEMRTALGDLARQGLVAKVDDTIAWERAEIDCHPLVREYFGSRLGGNRRGEGALDLATFQAAHGRLYDYYRYLGLPKEFQEPVAYGVLALVAAFPQVGSEIAAAAERRHWPDGWKQVAPPALLHADWARVGAAAKLINGRLWKQALAKFQPDTEGAMTPLFAAISHGCAAGRHADAFAELYVPRISRGNKNYAATTLGLIGQELAAYACFFDDPFNTVSSNLSPTDRAILLGNSGFRLRALGRLVDAVAPMRIAAKLMAEQKNWSNAATGSGNLCELLLIIGELNGEELAVATGQKALDYAEEQSEVFPRQDARIKFAPTLQAVGQIARAEALLRDAEALQQRDGGPKLASVAGSNYCQLLLARGRTAEAAERTGQSLEFAKSSNSLANIALDQMILAKIAIATRTSRAGSTERPATALTEAAVVAIRRANTEHHLPPGLIAHAEALWVAGDAKAAGDALREAEAIAKRGPMPLFEADATILRARIALSNGNIARAMTHHDDATKLIAKHGYGRAKPELTVLVAEIAKAAHSPMLSASLDKAITAIRGTPYFDERTGITIDGGWWGLWPRLDALLAADHPERASLVAARAAYNAERDAYLAGEAAELEAKAAADWLEEDRALADPAFRRELSAALVASGYKPLDDTPIAEQRNDARQYLKQKGGPGGRSGGGNKEPSIDPSDIPDEMLKKILGDPQARAAIKGLLKGAGIDTPFGEMSRLEQRAAVAAMMSAMQKAKEVEGGDTDADEDSDEAPSNSSVSDGLVRQVIADPRAEPLLRKVMDANKLTGPPAAQPFEIQRAIVEKLVETGEINFGGGDGSPPQGRAGPTRPKDDDDTPTDSDGSRGRWWPFGRKH